MSNKLQPVRGTHDILPDEHEMFSHVLHTAKRIGNLYGFRTISTPIFEFTDVFKRTLGETSDVVNKEMYTFNDRGNESITLRPEFTAGIARAFISNGMQQDLPLKLFSAGPLFRYERPQKGRQRQFHQVNFEYLGNAEPIADVEMIALANHILSELGIEKGLSLEINTLGDKESRDAYRNTLVKFFEKYKNNLSEDSKKRLELNPLRILDSKDEGDRKIIADAPKMHDSLSEEAKKFFEQVTKGLDALNIKYNINQKIVRGLDYYNHTVFEFVVNSEAMGSQNTILAGGRYDGLISQMGGQETPAFGFAAGFERLMMIAKPPAKNRHKVGIIAMGKELEIEAIRFAQDLRTQGHPVEVVAGSNPKKKFARADKGKYTLALIIGEDEIAKGVVTAKDLLGGNQQQFTREQISNMLHDIRKSLKV